MKRVVALFLIFAMLAPSVFILSVNTAKAQSIADTSSYYLLDVIPALQALQPQHADQIDTIVRAINNYVSDIEENSSNLVMMAVQGDTYIISAVGVRNGSTAYSGTLYYYNRFNERFGLAYDTSSTSAASLSSSNIITIVVSPDTYTLNTSSTSRTLWGTSSMGSYTFIGYYNTYGLVPCPAYFNRSDISFYSSKPISTGSWNTPASSKNLFAGSSEIIFDLVYFELGGKSYLTLKQQQIVRRFDPEKLDYSLYIGFDDSEIFNFWLDYSTLVDLGNISLFVDYSQFTGLGVFDDILIDHIYAWDISEYKYSIVDRASLYQFDGDPETDNAVGYAQNVPFTLSLGGGEPDNTTETYEYISEYINNYPNETITPQQLAVQMFGNKVTTAGIGCLSIPQNLYDYISALNSWGTSCTLPDHFEYKLSTGYYDPAETDILNLSLFSACIVPSPQYWYESNLRDDKTDKINVYVWDNGTEAINQISGHPKYAAYLSMNEIIDTFDCIIFLGNNTWSDAVFSDFYSDQPNFRQHPTMSYTSAEYNPYMDFDTLKTYGGADRCYVVYTNHAIEKNQMFLFADGMRKTYDLLSDYVEKRDLWDSSFFSWSMSIFTSLQTLDGSLNKIYKMLFDLKLNDYFQSVLDKLDQLVHNTDEQVHDFWILPLYNFVQTFVPSLTGFSNWIGAIEDFGEGMPAIPAITVPALPTISPTPPLIT